MGNPVAPAPAWWRSAVTYQIYPRSFQDADGDGVGDLAGIRARLDHLEWLGVDAIWLSPIYPSPQHDFGYDIADYEDIDPGYGTLAQFDALVEDAHARGIRLLMDLVPCHTSIDHPWFVDRPDFYVWHEGPAPPNNWKAAFGGSAWSWDEDRGAWYLHSFYPEQPDLDWSNPAVAAAMQDVVRFWMDRGIDGFRLDAIDRIGKDPQLRDDPPRTEPDLFGINHPEYGTLEHRSLQEHRRGARGAGRDPRGGGRRGLSRRRDLPAGDRLAALPREPRHRLRVPPVPRAAAVGARAPAGDRR